MMYLLWISIGINGVGVEGGTFEDFCSDDCVEVGFHVVEHKVYIFIILSFNDINQPYNILMAIQLL